MFFCRSIPIDFRNEALQQQVTALVQTLEQVQEDLEKSPDPDSFEMARSRTLSIVRFSSSAPPSEETLSGNVSRAVSFASREDIEIEDEFGAVGWKPERVVSIDAETQTTEQQTGVRQGVNAIGSTGIDNDRFVFLLLYFCLYFVSNCLI